MINLVLSFITLILGGALIIFIYDAYRIVKQKSLLAFTVGLFILVLALVAPDILTVLNLTQQTQFWGIVTARLCQIAGIGVMIHAVLRG